MLLPIILKLGSLKKRRKPVLDKWLYLVPEYKLEMCHPVTIHFTGACFFYGLEMLLSAIRTNAFNQPESCSVFGRIVVISLMIAYGNMGLILMHRAETTLFNDKNMMKLIAYFFRPLLIFFCILILVMGNIDQLYKSVYDSSNEFCYGYLSKIFSAVFLIGDAFFSIGLFLMFYIPLRRITILNRDAMKSGAPGELSDFDKVISRNFQSFLLIWGGNMGYVVISAVTGALQQTNAFLAEIIYSLIIVATISLVVGLFIMIWKALDFESTPYSCFKNKENKSGTPQLHGTSVATNNNSS
jgi:hypothetical protein